MLEAETDNEWTILDYLNDDCWCAVLQYVPVRDLIQTESTSRHWQKRLLQYMRGVRFIVIDIYIHYRPKIPERHSNDTALHLEKYESFAMWTNKFGSSVVATDCYSLETLKIIRENCPNLESLFVHDFPDSCGSGLSPYNLNKDFKSLKGLYFNKCCVTDNCINQFIADNALEELDIRHCPKVTGDFLNTINLSNLKSLALHSCDNFDLEHLIYADLGEFTSLILYHMKYRTLEVQEEIQCMLDRMPKLECLEIYNYNMTCHDYGPLSRLTCLQHLLVSIQVSDEGVEAILQNCKELTSLNFSDCAAMTGCSVAASVCRWGSRLRSLTLDGLEGLDDENVVTIIRGCPELMSLELIGSRYLTPDLPALASEARPAARPGGGGGVRLRLEIDYSLMSDEVRMAQMCGEYDQFKSEYEDLDIEFLSLP